MRTRRKAKSSVVVQMSATTRVTIHVRLAWIPTVHPSIACPEAVRRAGHRAGMVRGRPRKIPCLTRRSDSVQRPWARQRPPVGPNAQLHPVEGRAMRAVIVARSVIPRYALIVPGNFHAFSKSHSLFHCSATQSSTAPTAYNRSAGRPRRTSTSSASSSQPQPPLSPTTSVGTIGSPTLVSPSSRPH